MRKYPIHVTWTQGKTQNTLCITWGSKLSIMTLKSDAKFEEKVTCGLENDKEFGKISTEHSKISKLELWWNLFVRASHLQRSYMSWQWRMIQKLKRNWHVVLKLTWGIWRIFTRALESLKNRVLMGSLWPKYIMFELKKCKGVILHPTEEWCKI